jgi:hypothetical protein
VARSDFAEIALISVGGGRGCGRGGPQRDPRAGLRPAGQLFVHSGALYRPAQIGVPRHGAGLSINRVLRLTPEDYAERQVERILPLEGMRTVNRRW